MAFGGGDATGRPCSVLGRSTPRAKAWPGTTSRRTGGSAGRAKRSPGCRRGLRALEARMTRQELSEARSRTAGRRLATTISRSGRLDPPPERYRRPSAFSPGWVFGRGRPMGDGPRRHGVPTRISDQGRPGADGGADRERSETTAGGGGRRRRAGRRGPRPRNTCTRRRSGATSTDCNGFSRPEST